MLVAIILLTMLTAGGVAIFVWARGVILARAAQKRAHERREARLREAWQGGEAPPSSGSVPMVGTGPRATSPGFAQDAPTYALPPVSHPPVPVVVPVPRQPHGTSALGGHDPVRNALAGGSIGGGPAPSAPHRPPAPTNWAVERAAPQRRTRRRDPTITLSVEELQQMTIEDEGTTLAPQAAPAAAGRRVVMTAEIDISQELRLHTELRGEESGPVVPLTMRAFSGTHVGRKRKHNEDAVLMMPDFGVFGIADGMGGYAAGEVASQMTVDIVQNAYQRGEFGGTPIAGVPPRGDELVRAVQTANAAVLHESRTNPDRQGMGTTVVAARFLPRRQRIYIAHVGDSRMYRMRGDELTQLTLDHTLGAQGVTGPAAHKLSRAIGVFDNVEVDLNIDVPSAGDIYLICSDGLFKMVPELRIVEILHAHRDPERAVPVLIDEANARGGKDNVSIVMIAIEDDRRR